MAGWAVPPTIEVASIGIPDTMLLMLLALVVFGPRRLPEIGRQIGKLMYEFRKVSNDFKFQMEEELRASEEAERQKKMAEAQAQNQAQAALTASSEPAAPLTALEVEAEPVSAYGTSPEAAVNPEAPAASENVDSAPAVDGEVRGEPRSFPAGYVEGQIRIQPPTSGETVAAQKPFRGRVAEEAEVTTESGDEANRELETPVIVADEGRIGTEVQPGVKADENTRTVPAASTEDGREVHHA
ncbi:MAG TPA: twin-arginine translocase TatA/TatE family subunit [Acidobacteriaceae bacterium]|nr:twin-arginine translocase TatA/TatE family subunit [Acidobacteriaceae bacterium]